MTMNRELAVTILNRLGTTSADANTAMNVLIQFLVDEGNGDVADAFITRFNATSTITTTSLDQAVVTKARNRNYSGRSQHDRS